MMNAKSPKSSSHQSSSKKKEKEKDTEEEVVQAPVTPPEDEEEARARAPVKLLVQSARGMHDILPDEQPFWDVISDAVRTVCTSFNMRHITTPVVEAAALYTKSIGEETDIVEKEMYLLGGRSEEGRLALRPEFTAGVVRAYLEHGMASRPQPVRLWYQGQLFRHDRPQAGRGRQFSQWGVEVIGDAHPIIDAQVIHLAYEVYKTLQLDAFRIEINTIGCANETCRPRYIQALKAHLQENSRKLCATCRKRIKTNPLRVLDCKEEKCQMVINTGPKLSDFLCEDCKKHHAQVLLFLQELNIPYKENEKLVRGLDYYTRTVFEIVPTLAEWPEGTSPLSIGGGGRYDGLVQLLGGPSTPAVGFSGGIERTILQMRAEGIDVNSVTAPDVFLVHLGELGRRKSLALFDDLRRAGFRVAEAFHKEGMKGQLRNADRLRVPWALILGQKEALDNTIILRNMESGMQETLDANLDALLPALKRRLHRDTPTMSNGAEAL